MEFSPLKDSFIKVKENEEYKISEKLGEGEYGKVYRISQKNSKNSNFALKIFQDDDIDNYDNEVNILKIIENLNNKNIINIIYNKTGKIIDKVNKGPYLKKYIILEYASKGKLFNYLYYTNEGFPEDLCRLLFYKILKAIKALHDNNIFHLDINLNNILLDEEFQPKISDFNSSKIINTDEEIEIIKKEKKKNIQDLIYFV